MSQEADKRQNVDDSTEMVLERSTGLAGSRNSRDDFNSLSVSGAHTQENNQLQISVNNNQLLTSLNELTAQYEVMEKEFKNVITIYIPEILMELNNEKVYMDRFHKVTNLVTIGGAGAGVAGLFIPVAGPVVAIAGSIVVITAWIADICAQKQTKKFTKLLQEKFERKCKPAREAYEAVMEKFGSFCEEYVKCNPESLKRSRTIACPKYTGNSTIQRGELPAIQSASCGAAVGDLANTITSLAVDVEENATRFVSFLQKVGPIAGKIASTTVILGGICSGYVLLDTLLNFFKPCNASQNIEAYMQKIKTFGIELRHLLDKSNLGMMLMKSETQNVLNQRKIEELEEEKRTLLPYRDSYEEMMTCEKRLYTEEMEYQYQKTLEAIDQKFQRSLDTERQIHAERLENERQLYINKLASAKKQHQDQLKTERDTFRDNLRQQEEQFKKQHQISLEDQRKQYEELIELAQQKHNKQLRAEKEQYLEQLEAQRILQKDEKQQHDDKIKQYQDILKEQERNVERMLNAFLNQI